MRYLKNFTSYSTNEGYNLNTLKAYVDSDNKLYVRIKNKPGIHQVLNIDVNDIHNGKLRVKSMEDDGQEIDITHDDIEKSITQDEYTQQDMNPDTISENVDTADPEVIDIDAWLTFEDGQDGSYSVHLVGTKEEAIKIIGTDEPESIYDDGAIEPVKIKLMNKNGKWVIVSNSYVPIG